MNVFITQLYIHHLLNIYINSSDTAEGVNVPRSVNNKVIKSGGV